MSVRIIPISRAYRANWVKVFGRDSSNDRASVCSGEDAGLIPAPGSRDNVRICGPAVWPFDSQGRVMGQSKWGEMLTLIQEPLRLDKLLVFLLQIILTPTMVRMFG